MDDVLNGIIVVVIIAVVSTVLTIIGRRRINEAWSGVVTRVEEFKPRRGHGHRTVQEVCYRVFYRRDDGIEASFENTGLAFAASGGLPKPGDRMVKVKGEYGPRLAPQEPHGGS